MGFRVSGFRVLGFGAFRGSVNNPLPFTCWRFVGDKGRYSVGILSGLFIPLFATNPQ